MDQKFYSEPFQKSLNENVIYRIVRRNEISGDLEPIGFESKSEELTRAIASMLNKDYLEDSKEN